MRTIGAKLAEPGKEEEIRNGNQTR
jgi:hypothetical protein